MMVVSCCVVNCTTRFDKDNPNSFFRVPKKPDTRRKLWISAIKRRDHDGKAWEPSDHDRVCHLHFISGQKSNDKSNPDYVPSINMGYDERTDATLRAARHDRLQKRDAEKGRQEVASVLLDLSENVPPPEKATTGLHDQCIKTIASLRIENEHLYTELGRLQTENAQLKEEINKLSFGDQAIATNRKTQFYTGVPTRALFLWLVTFCSTILPTCKVMSPPSVLLCILMKLRLNIQHQDIAYRFRVSSTTISDLFNQGIPKIAQKLAFLVQWPDKDNIIKNMPVVFKQSYPRCVSIIDCFEVFIQRPNHLTARAQTWSNYKHNNTIKFLVSITPTGAISFVSKAFGGRTSDKVITQRSGYLDKLEHGDQVLADRGFLIAEELASRNASLIIPAFTRGKSQLSAREVEQTRKIAHVRIHVERAIEQLKNFQILSSQMGIYLVPHSDSIVTLCSAICNLHPKLVS
ncbi:uncharacterized protein LOC127734547 [Mytilus californianus]|uniref:uncharacterized protein LOC127734547 n=1 Tax=Mytilus californianus TaxID=6549 RepID=UPI0022479E73|nr:uncharacterized protein LOC127734547 [Mytilus californianus]